MWSISPQNYEEKKSEDFWIFMLKLQILRKTWKTLLDAGGYTQSKQLQVVAWFCKYNHRRNRWHQQVHFALELFLNMPLFTKRKGRVARKSVMWNALAGTEGSTALFIAWHFSQISRMGNGLAKTYFKRKISEGKSKSQALVCFAVKWSIFTGMMLKYKTMYRNGSKCDFFS